MLTPRLLLSGTCGVTGWVVSSSTSQRYPTVIGVPFPSTTFSVNPRAVEWRSARIATERRAAKTPLRRIPGIPAVAFISDLLRPSP
jgi:hypothetical protein